MFKNKQKRGLAANLPQPAVVKLRKVRKFLDFFGSFGISGESMISSVFRIFERLRIFSFHFMIFFHFWDLTGNPGIYYGPSTDDWTQWRVERKTSSVSQFVVVVRSRLVVRPSQSLHFIVGNKSGLNNDSIVFYILMNNFE